MQARAEIEGMTGRKQTCRDGVESWYALEGGVCLRKRLRYVMVQLDMRQDGAQGVGEEVEVEVEVEVEGLLEACS